MAVLHLHASGGVRAHPHLPGLVLTVLTLVLLVLTAVALLLGVDRLTNSGVITLAPGAEAADQEPVV